MILYEDRLAVPGHMAVKVQSWYSCSGGVSPEGQTLQSKDGLRMWRPAAAFLSLLGSSKARPGQRYLSLLWHLPKHLPTSACSVGATEVVCTALRSCS